MAIQIEVLDIHAKLLVDFYVQRLQALRAEIMERERETKEINAIIQKLRKGDSSKEQGSEASVVPTTPYSDKWTWLKKVQFAIEQKNKPLTTKEIVDTLTEYEPSFIFDRKRAIASISSILSSKSGVDKEFIKAESESGEFAYSVNPFGKPEDIFNVFERSYPPEVETKNGVQSH